MNLRTPRGICTLIRTAIPHFWRILKDYMGRNVSMAKVGIDIIVTGAMDVWAGVEVASTNNFAMFDGCGLGYAED